jgi:hypothetical protein
MGHWRRSATLSSFCPGASLVIAVGFPCCLLQQFTGFRSNGSPSAGKADGQYGSQEKSSCPLSWLQRKQTRRETMLLDVVDVSIGMLSLIANK